VGSRHTTENLKLKKMAIYTELNVYKCTYNLLYELLAASKSFNRDFKYTLGENLKNEMINAMMYVWRANSTYDKVNYIDMARESIEKCRLYIRLLYDLRQISIENFTKWNIAIQNISKQLSGWGKSENDKLTKNEELKTKS
jgi:hypothetical protein